MDSTSLWPLPLTRSGSTVISAFLLSNLQANVCMRVSVSFRIIRRTTTPCRCYHYLNFFFFKEIKGNKSWNNLLKSHSWYLKEVDAWEILEEMTFIFGFFPSSFYSSYLSPPQSQCPPVISDPVHATRNIDLANGDFHLHQTILFLSSTRPADWCLAALRGPDICALKSTRHCFKFSS